eukprot:74053_1
MLHFLFITMMLVMVSSHRQTNRNVYAQVIDRLQAGKSDLVKCINTGQNKAGVACPLPANTILADKLRPYNDWCGKTMKYFPYDICEGGADKYCTTQCATIGNINTDCMTLCKAHCTSAEQNCEQLNDFYGCCCATDVKPIACSTTCKCGEACKMSDGSTGTCQTDLTCAVNIQPPNCGTVNIPCTTCGESCTMTDGSIGVCQTDNLTCAINIIPPNCGCKCGEPCAMANGIGVCQADDSTCAINKQAPLCDACKCGESCNMRDGAVGVCQTDNLTCAVNIQAPNCNP